VSAWLIALVGVVYAYIAVEQFVRGDVRTAVVFAGYAFSNVGLYLLAR
jgi:hypothetical protein